MALFLFHSSKIGTFAPDLLKMTFMKKQLFRMAAAAMLLLCASSANAQISDILSNLKNNSSSSSSDDDDSSSSSILSSITSLFSSSKQATSSKIVGTWAYDEPAIVFESDNVLSSTAGKVAANSIEEKLTSVLEKLGFNEDMTVTFDDDGSFSAALSSKTISGTWEIEDEKLNLTVSKKTVSVTTQMDGSKTLEFLVDADNLLSLLQTLGSSVSSSNSTLFAISSLSSSIDGMEIGLSYSKQ